MLVKLASALPTGAAAGGEPSSENPTDRSREEAQPEETVTLAPEEDREPEAEASEPEGEHADEAEHTDAALSSCEERLLKSVDGMRDEMRSLNERLDKFIVGVIQREG